MKDRIAALLDDFSYLETWEDRYGYVIDLGKNLPPLAEKYRVDANKVQGCVSQVWLVAEEQEGTLIFHADSDAHIVKGLVSLLLQICSGASKEDIKSTDLVAAFDQMGLKEHLSPSRSNGFYAMIERVKYLAG